MRAGDSALERGDYARAVEALEAAVKKAQSFGEGDQRLLESLTSLAMLYDIQGRSSEADVLYRQVRDTKRAGDEYFKGGIRSSKLGEHFKEEGRYSEAEVLFKRALVLYEEALGKDHQDVAYTLSHLAVLFMIQGRYYEAEALHKRTLAINEKVLGSDHPRVSADLNNLAVVFHYQGRFSEAEPLHKRALAIKEKALGPTSVHVATDLYNLAELYTDQGRYSEAEPLYARSLSIVESPPGFEDFYVARSLSGLARLYKAQGRYSEAEPLYARSLAIYEKKLPGPGHVNVGIELNAVAELFERQGRYSKAVPVLERALSILEKTLGPEHPFVARVLENLATVYQEQGRYGDALSWIRKATTIYRARATRASGERSAGAVSEQQHRSREFVHHVRLLGAIDASKLVEQDRLVTESFEVSQLARTGVAANALAKMAARFARGDDELAIVVRARQDRITRWQVIDAELLKAAARPPRERNVEREIRLREELAGLEKQLAKLDADLEKRFPEYKELASPQPLAREEAQKLLGNHEALVSYLVDEKASYLWVLRKEKADFKRIEIGKQELDKVVRRLRRALEPFGGMTLSEIHGFPVKEAYKLYRLIFAPAEPLLKDASHVMIVPDGALQSLPFGVLVTEEAKGPVAGFSGYREVAWLARKYALSVLPSEGSLRALRRFAKGAFGDQPFTGFGDPVLEGEGGSSKGLDAAALFSRGTVADVSEVRRLPRLTETAEELFAMAGALGADKQHVNLREAATEARAKGLDLSIYRTLAFSTHALMAGDFKGLAEPALVLTPPSEGTELDDGLLTASEVAKLKLNADWVILSACNTAAADGAPGAEGLSGLARAFFYAGSRALLVSHWAVSSDATVELMTKMFMVAAENPGIGKSEALRRSMLSLMNSQVKPHYAHPMFWAPFVVVGEGGETPAAG